MSDVMDFESASSDHAPGGHINIEGIVYNRRAAMCKKSKKLKIMKIMIDIMRAMYYNVKADRRESTAISPVCLCSSVGRAGD